MEISGLLHKENFFSFDSQCNEGGTSYMALLGGGGEKTSSLPFLRIFVIRFFYLLKNK